MSLLSANTYNRRPPSGKPLNTFDHPDHEDFIHYIYINNRRQNMKIYILSFRLMVNVINYFIRCVIYARCKTMQIFSLYPLQEDTNVRKIMGCSGIILIARVITTAREEFPLSRSVRKEKLLTTKNPSVLKNTEQLVVSFYQSVITRSYASIMKYNYMII